MEMLFDKWERKAINEGDQRLNLRLSSLKLKREFLRSYIGRLVIWITEKLKNLLND